MALAEVSLPRAVLRPLYWAAGTVAAFVCLVALWAGFAPLATSIPLSGRIVSAHPGVDLQHPYGGQIAEVLVRKHTPVQQGQLLIRFEDALERDNLAAMETLQQQIKDENQIITLILTAPPGDQITATGAGAHHALRYRQLQMQRQLQEMTSRSLAQQMQALDTKARRDVVHLDLLRNRVTRQKDLVAQGTIRATDNETLRARMLALDFTHSRALAGFRRLREENRMRVQALLALPVFLVLSVIHPLAGLGLPLGIGTGALALWGLSRLGTVENPWGFVPAEAMSILAGRDTAGLDLASATESNHALAAPVRQGGSWLAVLGAVASGSYLVASDVLVPGAVLALWSYWITDRTLAYLTVSALRHQHNQPPSAVVRRLETEIMEDPRDGLVVQDLTVRSTGGTPYLNAVSMQVDPGEVVGIIGESGTGKSLFLRALADPFSLAGLEISGAVHWDQQDFWERRATRQRLQAVYLPDQPLLLPTSGANNLACFQDAQLLDRGKWMLEQMVFAHDMVEQICAAPDARLLPSMQRQALALTRAFLLSPNIYLLDQPERALGDSQIAALSRRIDRETRLGRSVVLVSDNRTLLEKCDRLYVLQDGRFVDYGPADEIRTRMAGGWARFIGKRRLSSEDTLEPWIRSHFRRDGDEGNRRKVCIVASELLALSCRNADPNSTETVQFLFKHFEGHCLLQMIDGDPPLSSGQMQIAADLAKAKTLEARKNILASIMTHCQEFDAEGHLDGRILRAKIATYDPRKVKASAGGDHGPRTR